MFALAAYIIAVDLTCACHVRACGKRGRSFFKAAGRARSWRGQLHQSALALATQLENKKESIAIQPKGAPQGNRQGNIIAQ